MVPEGTVLDCVTAIATDLTCEVGCITLEDLSKGRHTSHYALSAIVLSIATTLLNEGQKSILVQSRMSCQLMRRHCETLDRCPRTVIA